MTRGRLSRLGFVLCLSACPATEDAGPTAEHVASPQEGEANAASPKGAASPDTSTASTNTNFAPRLVGDVLPNAAPESFEFAMKVPCEVQARRFSYRSEKDSSVIRLRVEFSRHSRGIEVRLFDLELESFKGQPMDAPELRDAAKTFTDAAATSLPSFVISRRGQFIQTTDAGQRIAQLKKMYSGELSQGVLTVAGDEADMVAQLEAETASRWADWSGRWNGVKLTPGLPQPTEDLLVNMRGSDSIDSTNSIEHLGTVRTRDDLRLLRHVSDMGGGGLAAATADTLREVSQQLGRPRPPAGVTDSMRRTSTLYAAVEPAHGIAHRTRRETTVTAQGHKGTKIEEWEFAWSLAKGCR